MDLILKAVMLYVIKFYLKFTRDFMFQSNIRLDLTF